MNSMIDLDDPGVDATAEEEQAEAANSRRRRCDQPGHSLGTHPFWPHFGAFDIPLCVDSGLWDHLGLRNLDCVCHSFWRVGC